VDLDTISDAVPREEPLAAYGNNPEYEILGTVYRRLESSEGYEEVGTASWYGEEFQGRRTSSGEPYDMYGMTAAHRTLPLPTYVEITNLDNGKRVVVRVNDRGPFHGGRLIDVSYAAAHRLGMLGHGTARVRVRALRP
jgi:rare lipoprotein A